MALDSATGAVVAEQGETAMRANFIHKITFDGDAAYPGAAGSANFQQFVRDVVGEVVTIAGITGYAITAGAITHLLHYDSDNDTLEMFAIATGAAQGAGDQSAAECHVVVFSA